MNTLSSILLLFDDDEEDDNLLLMRYAQRKRTHEMFLNRESEGAYQILVSRYLIDDEEKFIQFFRINRATFFHILDSIREDISTKPYNRHKNPISAEEKLCIALRYYDALPKLR